MHDQDESLLAVIACVVTCALIFWAALHLAAHFA